MKLFDGKDGEKRQSAMAVEDANCFPVFSPDVIAWAIGNGG
jgi:hypothetical protein